MYAQPQSGMMTTPWGGDYVLEMQMNGLGQPLSVVYGVGWSIAWTDVAHRMGYSNGQGYPTSAHYPGAGRKSETMTRTKRRNMIRLIELFGL